MPDLNSQNIQQFKKDEQIHGFVLRRVDSAAKEKPILGESMEKKWLYFSAPTIIFRTIPMLKNEFRQKALCALGNHKMKIIVNTYLN